MKINFSAKYVIILRKVSIQLAELVNFQISINLKEKYLIFLSKILKQPAELENWSIFIHCYAKYVIFFGKSYIQLTAFGIIVITSMF